jgi:DnaJ domain
LTLQTACVWRFDRRKAMLQQSRPVRGEIIRTASAIDDRARRSRKIKTLYDVLGVRPDADEEIIERAFRETSKAYHPDLHGGDPGAAAWFKEILAAAAILRDPERRAAYDLSLRRERRRRREWAATAILFVFASAIVSGGLLSGRLVLPRIVLKAEPSVAAVPTTQPGEAQVRTEPDPQPSVVQTRNPPVTASDHPVVERENLQPEPIGESTPAPVASAEPPQRHLDASEIASLVKRGMELAANGNIGAARMMFKPAAEAGDATAAFDFAETYDPWVLEKLGAKGVTPDVALAQQWYDKARALGSTATPGQLLGHSH